MSSSDEYCFDRGGDARVGNDSNGGPREDNVPFGCAFTAKAKNIFLVPPRKHPFEQNGDHNLHTQAKQPGAVAHEGDCVLFSPLSAKNQTLSPAFQGEMQFLPASFQQHMASNTSSSCSSGGGGGGSEENIMKNERGTTNNVTHSLRHNQDDAPAPVHPPLRGAATAHTASEVGTATSGDDPTAAGTNPSSASSSSSLLSSTAMSVLGKQEGFRPLCSQASFKSPSTGLQSASNSTE